MKREGGTRMARGLIAMEGVVRYRASTPPPGRRYGTLQPGPYLTGVDPYLNQPPSGSGARMGDG